jgi:PST family polysaccharide transporter
MTDAGPDPSVRPRARLSTNAAWLFLAQLVVVAIGLIVTIAISRLLGPVELGRWRFAQALFAYGLVFTDVGLSVLAIRELARTRGAAAATYGFPVILVQLAAALGVYALIVVAMLASDLPDRTKLVTAALGLAIFPQALSMAHVLQAHERMELVARIRILNQALSGVAGLAGLIVTRDLLALVVPLFVTTLATDVWIAYRVRRDHGVPFTLPSLQRLVRLAGEGTPFLLSSLALLLIFNADAILLEIFRGERDLGWYAASYSPASQLLLLGGPLVAAAYPRLAALAVAPDQGLRLLKLLLAMLGALILPIALGGAVLADKIVAFLYGAGYEPSVPVLVILMGLPAIGYYNMSLMQSISARGHQPTVMVISFVTAAVNIAANLILIPTAGIVGAATAMLIGEATAAIAYTGVVVRQERSVVLLDYFSSLPAATFMALVVLLVRLSFDVDLIPAIALGAATYLAAAIGFPTPATRFGIMWLRTRLRRAS